MGKKKKHEEHENLERWLVSYADFITLLFATFTALYALSVADLAKMKNVAQSIRDGFQEQSLISGINSILSGKSQPSSNPSSVPTKSGEGEGILGKHKSLTYTKGETERAEQTVVNLKKAIQDINKNIQSKLGQGGAGAGGAPRGIELAVQERGIRVSFDSTLLFEPGSATLKPESKKALDVIAQNLKPMAATNFIHIEGHTDNTKIASALFPSNWELSAGRSSTVVRYLIDKHSYRGDHLAAVGYGDTRPFTSNLTPQGRAQNRRIDIIVYGQVSGQAVDVRSQYASEETLIKAVDQENNIQVIIHHEPAPKQDSSIPTVQEDDIMGKPPEPTPAPPPPPEPPPKKETKPATTSRTIREELDLGKFKPGPKPKPDAHSAAKADKEHDGTLIRSKDQ